MFFCFQFIDFCSLLLPSLPLLPLRDCLGTGVWGNREKRKRNDGFLHSFWELGVSFPSPWALLELSQPALWRLLPVFWLLRVQGGGEQREKMVSWSPPVPWFFNFWSSFPMFLLLFTFQSSPILSRFYSCSRQNHQVDCVSSIRSRLKLTPTFFELIQRGFGDLLCGAILSSTSTAAPSPWASLVVRLPWHPLVPPGSQGSSAAEAEATCMIGTSRTRHIPESKEALLPSEINSYYMRTGSWFQRGFLVIHKPWDILFKCGSDGPGSSRLISWSSLPGQTDGS